MGLQKPKGEVHDFEQSLKVGKKGEAQFYELFKDLVDRESGFVQDFTIKANGKSVELKMDTYCPTKTENFFMERWSYKNQDGGPWQALRKNVDYFCYFFPSCMQLHIWETKALVRKLDEITDGMYIHNIYNKNHVTQGYVVKRSELESLELDIMNVLKGKI